MPSYRGVCDNGQVGCFQLLSNGFLRLIVFKHLSHFVVCSFLSNCYRALLEWSHIFSSEIQVVFCFTSVFLRYFDLVKKFFFPKTDKVFDVIFTCCYYCLILLFFLTCFLNI